MLRPLFVFTMLIPLAACGVQVGGPAYISARSPAAAQAQSAEPEPAGSLPKGAAGLYSGPTSTLPDFGSLTVRSPL